MDLAMLNQQMAQCRMLLRKLQADQLQHELQLSKVQRDLLLVEDKLQQLEHTLNTPFEPSSMHLSHAYYHYRETQFKAHTQLHTEITKLKQHEQSIISKQMKLVSECHLYEHKIEALQKQHHQIEQKSQWLALDEQVTRNKKVSKVKNDI
ncbi:hypothetical protein [Cysteiniphilum sp. QT6929]|uniref:hypothetical protein n=1 Tax=Cysteiniphilum sp. QT6929 TaxID=2975055 RepID=UPI0024B354FD|nr:hypothetical protein [Cysteiniphilum sp. QT6929]WHN66101.1 hypothetical protein NYP54_02400 [Cysteiniphilum sp. QT6929]